MTFQSQNNYIFALFASTHFARSPSSVGLRASRDRNVPGAGRRRGRSRRRSGAGVAGTAHVNSGPAAAARNHRARRSLRPKRQIKAHFYYLAIGVMHIRRDRFPGGGTRRPLSGPRTFARSRVHPDRVPSSYTLKLLTLPNIFFVILIADFVYSCRILFECI